MTEYRLNKAEKVRVLINNVAKTKVINGKSIVTYSNYINLVPGVVYKTDDEAMLNFFRNYKRKVRYNAEVERALKENNVPYEIEMCRSCGGKIKKISYRPVEVIE
ncbi:MAG: hypothetical protein IIY21_19860 [Clostridiales bacterium]|nr:hypothetical protein [Clostridiales bacterium]MBQ1572051.1 hypothetical protein [Clostridiales bacterium]